MKNLIKENWFKLIVVVLLIMIYSRLGAIKGNTVYTADMVDASTSRVVDSLNDRLDDMEAILDSILYELQ